MWLPEAVLTEEIDFFLRDYKNIEVIKYHKTSNKTALNCSDEIYERIFLVLYRFYKARFKLRFIFSFEYRIWSPRILLSVFHYSFAYSNPHCNVDEIFKYSNSFMWSAQQVYQLQPICSTYIEIWATFHVTTYLIIRTVFIDHFDSRDGNPSELHFHRGYKCFLSRIFQRFNDELTQFSTLIIINLLHMRDRASSSS